MPIFKNEDFIQGNPLKPLSDMLDLLDKKANQLKATMASLEKNVASVGKTGNGAEAKALTTNITKLSQETEKLNNIQKAELQIKQQMERASAKYQAILNTETNEYKKQSAILNKLRGDYKNLAVQNKENTKEAKALLNQITALDTKLKRVDASVGQHTRNVGNYGKALSNLGGMIKNFFFAGGILMLVQKIGQFFKTSSVNADIQAKAIGKVEQVIISTGGAAGKTSEELQKMASALQENSIFGDEKILNDVTAQLLTFTNVSGTEFDRATQAALDMNTVIGGDLKSNTIQLGKALNDPVRGMASLRRVGVSFTADQEKVVKQLVKTGEVAKAQQIILSELEKEFGGQAKRAAEMGLGPLQKLQNSWGDFKELIGNGLNVVINKFAKIASDALGKFIDFTKRSIAYVVDFINGWIDLYNESLAFRAVVNAIGSSFNFMWQTVKLVFSLIIDNLKGIGKAFGYTFNPKNWGEGFYDGLKEILFDNAAMLKKDVKDYGKEIADDFNKGLENIKNGKARKLSLDFTPLGSAVTKEQQDGLGSGVYGTGKETDVYLQNLADESSASPFTKIEEEQIEAARKKEIALKEINDNLAKQDIENAEAMRDLIDYNNSYELEAREEMLKELEEQEQRKQEILAETFELAAEQFGELLANGELTYREFGKVILKTALDIAEKMLLLAIADIWFKNIAAPGRSIRIALLTGLVKGVFAGIKSQVQNFAEGTDYVNGPGTETSDSIPANLSKGEAIVKASNNKKIMALGIGANDNRLPSIISAGLNSIRMEYLLREIKQNSELTASYLANGKNIWNDETGKWLNVEDWRTGSRNRYPKK